MGPPDDETCVAVPATRLTRAKARPSVVLMSLDTVRADHLTCYGYDHIETPAIDRLALEGLRFNHAYAQVPLTLPSHTVILTGTYPMFNGVRDLTSPRLAATVPTLAELKSPVAFFQSLIGNDKDFLATQVSYKLNLNGPSLSTQNFTAAGCGTGRCRPPCRIVRHVADCRYG